MKTNIFKILCLTAIVGMTFVSCKKEPAATDGKKYTVTVVSANEQMGKAYGGGQFDAGTATRIWGTPELGYQFVRWNDGITENPRNITVNSDITYTAYFAEIGGGTDTTDPGDTPGPFTASYTINGTTTSGIALISYGGDNNTGLFDLIILTGEGGESDPMFAAWVRPQAGTQGFDMGANCMYLENANDFVDVVRDGQTMQFPHYQTNGNCTYNINVTAFDMNAQTVTLTASGQMLDIRRAEAGEGMNFIDFSCSIDGNWQYPQAPSTK